MRYDTNGNLTSYNGWTYSYDVYNRLIKSVNGGMIVPYYYDGLNRQIAHDVGAAHTYEVWDGWNLLEERNNAGNIVHCCIHVLKSSSSIRSDARFSLNGSLP